MNKHFCCVDVIKRARHIRTAETSGTKNVMREQRCERRHGAATEAGIKQKIKQTVSS